MEKILVATDLSSKSASAIRFAMYLAHVKNIKLIIVHVYYVRKPNNWRKHRFETYIKVRKTYLNAKLTRFLEKIFKEFNEGYVNFETEIVMNVSTITTLLNTASLHKAAYICISTQGSGKSEYKFGRITSKLIVKSSIPVICIPSAYVVRPIEEICYTTDLHNYQKEIRKVINFANPFQMTIKLLHIASTQEILPKINALENKLLKKTGTEIKVRYISRNPVNTLHEDINFAVTKMKSSLVIVFIHRSKPYLQSMFHPKKIQSLLFHTKIPILSFKK